MRRGIPGLLVGWLALAASGLAADVTFLVTSDSHYDAFENEDRNERNRATVVAMNHIAELTWPEKLGGERIGTPRAVLLLGDVLDDADRRFQGKSQGQQQWAYFVADFGLDGTDGRLKFPVFEGWGNHDGPPAGKERHGFSFQAQLKQRNQLRKAKGLISDLSDNGLHYSWDWDGVHFVQLNLYPGDEPHPKTRYSPAYHHPQRSLSFLRADLAANVAKSGRPVVLVHHYDLQGTDWWHDDERNAYREAIGDYNVVAVFHGHTGTGVYKWQGLDVVNTGQTENGFFVVQITDTRLRLAYRLKDGQQRGKKPDGTTDYEWGGAWTWRHLLDKPVLRPGKASAASVRTSPSAPQAGHR